MIRQSTAVLALSALLVAAPVQAEEFSVTPLAGSAEEAFVFEGAGFTPGVMLNEAYVAPNGDKYSYFVRGDQAFVQVAEDGAFRVEVLLTRDIPGYLPGLWRAEYCYPGGECWTVAFEVVP